MYLLFNDQRGTAISSLLRTVISILAFNAVFLTISIKNGISGHDDPLFYFQERRGVTFFSALFLGCTCLTNLIVSYLHHKLDTASRFLNFWFISAFGFFYLCLDEYFMIHEGMDRAILESFGKDPHLINFDAWILGGFGLIGIGLFWYFRSELFKYRDFFILFFIAMACFSVMVLFDHYGSHSSPWMIFEDSFKILGSTFFLGSYLSALAGYHKRLFNRFNAKGF